MPFDGVITSNIVFDLNNKINNGKIEKIYQPEPDEILLNIHSNNGAQKLLISSNSHYSRVHLIKENKSNPQTPPNFCMLLRKHIQSGRISSVKQIDSERIIEICIDTFNELGVPVIKKLIIEIMGKHSNIILVDFESNRIIDSIKRISGDVNRYRQILPGKEYIAPPGHNKISYFNDIDQPMFQKIMKERSDKLSASLVGNFQGISPFMAYEVCFNSELEDTTITTCLSDDDFDRLYDNFDFYISKIKKAEFTPCVFTDDLGIPIDFYSYTLNAPARYSKILPFSDISSAAEYYYSKKDSFNRAKQKSSDLYRTVNTILDKYYLKKQKLLEDIIQANSSDHYRLYGELITANIYQMKQGMKNVTVENYYNGEQIEIELDNRLSPSENAQKYFKKYTKARTALKEKNIQLEETEKEISYFESVLINIENTQTGEDIEAIRHELIAGNYLKKRKADLKLKKIESKPYAFTSKEGYKILVGKNNQQNDILTLRTASNKDLWFHTKDMPGSHVIVQTEGKEVPENTIREAASIAAYYSKGRMSENVPVDYTYIKNVRKPSGAKPGMVIFDNHKTIYANPKLPE